MNDERLLCAANLYKRDFLFFFFFVVRLVIAKNRRTFVALCKTCSDTAGRRVESVRGRATGLVQEPPCLLHRHYCTAKASRPTVHDRAKFGLLLTYDRT